MKKITVLVLVCMALLLVCAPGFAAEKKIKIGLSLPTQEVERWVRDKDNLIAEAQKLGVEIKVQIANNDANKQIAQVENLISEGVDVIIIAPHDGKASAKSVEDCKAANIPVIGYVRMIMNSDVDLHIADDIERCGDLQGEYLVKHVPKGNIIVLKGAVEDFNSVLFHRGAMKFVQPLVDKGDLKIVMDQNVQNWEPEKAMKIVENALTANKNKIDGVLCPNDSTAAGAIEALAAQGLAGKVPVTGGDAGVDAARRIVEGSQSMTVYRDLKVMDKAVMDAAVRLAKGEKVPDVIKALTEASKGMLNAGVINNELKDVPAILLAPVTVTKENLDEILIKSGYHTREAVYGKGK
jgi:D-xylose transport system substrate-binding protein